MPWGNNGETFLGKTIGRAGPSFFHGVPDFFGFTLPEAGGVFYLAGRRSFRGGRPPFFAAKGRSGMRTEGRPFVMEGRAAFVVKAGGIFPFFARKGKIRSRKEDRKAAGPAADFLGRTGIRAEKRRAGIIRTKGERLLDKRDLSGCKFSAIFGKPNGSTHKKGSTGRFLRAANGLLGK